MGTAHSTTTRHRTSRPNGRHHPPQPSAASSHSSPRTTTNRAPAKNIHLHPRNTGRASPRARHHQPRQIRRAGIPAQINLLSVTHGQFLDGRSQLPQAVREQPRHVRRGWVTGSSRGRSKRAGLTPDIGERGILYLTHRKRAGELLQRGARLVVVA
jgi:hypothetical protein